MTERIQRMTQGILEKTVYPDLVPVDYDRMDILLPDPIMTGKRLADFMQAQTVVIGPDNRLVGQLKFDGAVPADIFSHSGHKRWGDGQREFYEHPVDNLGIWEHQHAAIDFADVIEHGIEGKLTRIEKALEVHRDDPRKVEFLTGCRLFCQGVLAWAEKCAAQCRKAAETADPQRRAELLTIAENLDQVPRKPARTFYEGVQCVYFCFSFLPDSIGTPDRYLRKLYQADKARGVLTDELARELLQELYLCIQSYTDLNSPYFTRGGQSHFCVGGYDAAGNDTTDELTFLVAEALLELPLFIPQISFRWTQKTPTQSLYRMMDLERKDPHKRLAFVNDEPRIRGFVENCGLSREVAVNYTMVGCNEPMLQGGMWYEGKHCNLARSLNHTLYRRREDIVHTQSFDEFYEIYRQELYADLGAMSELSDSFNIARGKDIDIMSSVFLRDCIESGTSVTQGGALGATGMSSIGLVTVLDSLAVIQQFVFDEKRVSFQTLLDALDADWVGHEALRAQIRQNGKFFGNGYPETDKLCRRFNRDLHTYYADKTDMYGKRFLVGNIIGYRQHHQWFGSGTKATPDGRSAGEPLTYGLSQINGHDREGLTALLASVAGFDQTCICCGPSVTNINVDAPLVKNDANFEKLVQLIESYFRLGGLQIQINSVSAEELHQAQENPDKYRSLRVRVSGFSDFFTNLNQPLQEEIIKRTEHSL